MQIYHAQLLAEAIRSLRLFSSMQVVYRIMPLSVYAYAPRVAFPRLPSLSMIPLKTRPAESRI